MQVVKEAKNKKPDMSEKRVGKSSSNNPNRHPKKQFGHGLLIDQDTGRTIVSVMVEVQFFFAKYLSDWPMCV